MTAYRQPWDSSNWMDGSISSSAGFENRDRTAVGVEAALEPLPTWDGAAYEANYDDSYEREPVAGESRMRQRDRAPNYLRERALRDPDSADFNLESGERRPHVRDYAALRPSNLAGNPRNAAERGPPRSIRRSASPGENQERPAEDGGTLTHVIRLHRTGSVEVERMRGSSTQEDTADDQGEIGEGRRTRQTNKPGEADVPTFTTGFANARPRSEPSAGYGYYAEEERFWQARCPTSTVGGREAHHSAQKLAATAPSRPIGGPTSIAHPLARTDHTNPNGGHTSNRRGYGHAEATRITRLEGSGDTLNEPWQPPAAGDGCGKGVANVRRKRLSTMASGVLGSEGSGAGPPLPGSRDTGACRVAGVTERSPAHVDLLTRKRAGVSVSTAEGVLVGTDETSLLSSGAVPLGGGVAPTRGGGVANSSRLDGRYRAPGMKRPPPPPSPPPPSPPPPPPPPRPSQREGPSVAEGGDQRLPEDKFDGGGVKWGGLGYARQRRVRSLQGVESTLQAVLESVKRGLRNDDISMSARAVGLTRTPHEEHLASLRGQLNDAASMRNTPDSEGALPIADNRDGRGVVSKDSMHTAAGAGGLDGACRHQSARRDRDGLFETLRTGGKRQQIEEGEGEEAEVVVAERVIELSKGIALRCLHLEQECLRRGRTQSRLFQEQLRGVRQAAQDMTRRAIRAERMGAKRRLEDAQKLFAETEAALLAKDERAEEVWKVERETFVANAAAAKSELDQARRLSREEAEERRRDAEAALEAQKLELQRGWTEEKGRTRRAAEDALRRAEEGRARAEVEAALQMRTVQTSLEAQVRSWKSKAEAAERRAAEERGKRRELEAGGKGPLAQETEKARQQQETALRDMSKKCEEDRGAHAREIERLEEEHRAHVLRVHLEKKKTSEAARRQRQQETQEFQAEAAAKAEEAATHAVAERAEALRRLRLAHDAEMRKAGRDVLRLERQLRIRQRERPEVGVVSRLKSEDLDPALPPAGSCSPKVIPPKVAMGP